MQPGDADRDRSNVEDRRGLSGTGIKLGLGGTIVLSGAVRQVRRTRRFAQAYVIAHEVGHHVQTLLGVTERAQRAQQRDPAARNAVSVRVELQADCFAGVWGHSAAQRTLLDPGDVEEGLRAAAAVGDDHIQKMAGRRVSPESFTHGSAAERARWFRRGLDTGSLRACDTFAID